MNVIETRLPGVLLVEPRVFGDARGFFFESFSAERYASHGIPGPFVQDNVSLSRRGVLRGLHFQHPRGQAKLVSVLRGEVFDVAVDIRIGSPTHGQWIGEHLSSDNKRQLYIPAGFAHGFAVLSDEALFAYKCTDYYLAANERSLRWDDPALGIEWPVDEPALSAKDADAPRLVDIAPELLPSYFEAR